MQPTIDADLAADHVFGCNRAVSALRKHSRIDASLTLRSSRAICDLLEGDGEADCADEDDEQDDEPAHDQSRPGWGCYRAWPARASGVSAWLR